MKKHSIILGLILMFFSGTSFSAIIRSQAPGGAWNLASTWQGGIVPTANDTVRIIGGSAIQVTESASISFVDFLDDTATNSLTVANGVSFSVTGRLRFGIPTRNDRQFLFDVGSGNATLADVVYGMPSGDTRRLILRVNTGQLVVQNGFDMNGADYGFTRRRLELVGAGSVVFQCPLQNISTLVTSPGSSVSYLGAGDYSIFSVDYHHFTLNAAGTKRIGAATIKGKASLAGNSTLSLGGTLTLQDSVSFNGGVVVQNNSNLVLSGNFSLVGSFGAANHINQNGTGLLQIVGDSAQRFLQTFPLGSNGKYSPITITRLAANFPGTAGSRNMELKAYDFRHPVLTGTDNAAKRFWRIRTNNITVVTKFGVSFTYADQDVASPIDESTLTSVGRLRGTGWQVDFAGSSVNQTNNQIVVDSTNTIIDGDYTLGQSAAFPVSVPYVFSVRNGGWGTAANWSTGSVPSVNSDVVVLHTISDMGGSVNNVTVTSPGFLAASSGNVTINGTLSVFGQFNDSHSGGTNTILGKTTIHPGGVITGSGSGSGTSFTFANDIENNGSWNVGANTIRFSRQVKNVLSLSGTSPINFFRTQGTILSLVDTLKLSFTSTAQNPALFEPNFIVGDTSYSFNCIVVNNSAVAVNNLSSRNTAGFSRRFIQGNNAYLAFRSGQPFLNSNGVLEASTPGNTVEYNQGSSQTISALNYHHLVLTGDRADRFKTLASGSDVTVSGNLTINNNAATFQFSNTSNGQKLDIKGDLILNGNAVFRTAPSNDIRNTVTLGGKIINNSAAGFGLNFKTNDSTYTNLVLNGSGVVAEGSGNARLRQITLAGSDTMRWVGSGALEVSDTLVNNAPGFHQSNGLFYIPTDAKCTMKGSSSHTRFKRLVATDRGDRKVSIFQRLNIEVDSLFHMVADGRTSLGAFYDFAGQTLRIKGEYRVGANGNTSVMRPDSTSRLIFEGNAPSSTLTLANGFRKLGELIHRKNALPLGINQPVAIYKSLDLLDGAMTGTGNIRMIAGSTVRRAKGSVNNAFSNTSGKYNLEYWNALTTGPEAVAIPTINKITLRAPEADTITFSNSPSLDSNLVYQSGKLKALANNYVRLGAASGVEISSVQSNVFFPVGTLTAPSFMTASVNAIGGGKVVLKPFRAEPANLPAIPTLTKLNRYVDVSGNATGLNLDLGFTYVDQDVTNDEQWLEANFWNGTSWSTTNGSVDNSSNRVQMTGITGNGVLAAFGFEVSVKDKKEGSTVSVWPNPGQGLFRIQAKGSVEITGLKDVLGKSVLFEETKTENGLLVNLDRVPKGLYFVTLKEGDKETTLRLVKN